MTVSDKVVVVLVVSLNVTVTCIVTLFRKFPLSSLKFATGSVAVAVVEETAAIILSKSPLATALPPSFVADVTVHAHAPTGKLANFSKLLWNAVSVIVCTVGSGSPTSSKIYVYVSGAYSKVCAGFPTSI